MSKFKNYSRRDFIKEFGVAAGVAIPFLKSSVALGQTTTAPLRLLIVPLQHGWGFDKGISGFSGSEFSFIPPNYLNAFNSIRNQCVFIDGLRSTFWGNAHDVSYSDLLTCGVRYNAPGNSALGGPFPTPSTPSLDWLLSQHLKKDVLRFCANYGSFGAAYHPLSFDGGLNSLPYFTKPRDAYMGVIDPLRIQQLKTAPELAATHKSNDVLLKFLGKDADRLLKRLAGDEKVKMERYISSLNALGNRILSPAQAMDLSSIILPNSPGITLTFNEMLDSYLEMIKVAFTLDTHRVAILGIGDKQPTWNWINPITNLPQVGNTFGADFHHEIAHYHHPALTEPGSPSFAAYRGWVDWHVAKIATFVNTISGIQDVDGQSLLDNTLIVLTGEVGNGGHETRDIVYTLIGGGNRIRRNRWIQTPKVEPRNRKGVFWGSRDEAGNLVESTINYGGPVSRHHIADLWVSIARLMGLPINSLGIDVYNYQPISLT